MEINYTSKIESISDIVYDVVEDFLTDVVIDQMEEFGIDSDDESWDAIHDAICTRVIAMMQA